MSQDQASQLPSEVDLRGQREGQQQFLHALELVADGVITLNPEGQVTYLNAAARRMLAEQGCPADSILNKPLAGTWQVSWLWQAIFEASSKGQHNNFEHSDIASGRCYWVRTLSAPNGGLTVFAQDITERREWEVRFRALTDEAPVAIGISRQGKLLYANPSYRRCFGMDEQELLVGKSIFEQIAPEEHQRIRQYVRQRYGGEPVAPSYNFTAIRTNGSRFPALVEVGQIQLPDGPATLAFITDVSDRKTSEQQLKEHARLLDLSNDSILVRDAQNRITYWSRGAMEAYGYSREEALGQPVHTLLKTVFPEPLDSIQTKLLQEGRWSGELLHTRKDGSTVVDMSRWALDRDAQGQTRAVLETNTDITARKRAEDERHRFVALAEGSTEFVGMCDLQGRPFFVNEAGRRLVGLTRPLAEINACDWFFPEDWPFVQQQFLPRVLREGNAEAELRFRHFQTGAAIWVIYNVWLLKDPDGKEVGFATVSRNITEQKAAEAALQESNERLQRAQEAARLGTWDWDLKSNRLVWSDGIYRLLGLNPGECEPRPELFIGAIIPEDSGPAQAALQRVLSQPGEFSVEFRIRRTDGQVRWLASRGRVDFEDGTVPSRMLGVNIDITERKKAELELRRSEERFRQLAESMPQLVWTANPNGTVDYYNHQISRYAEMPVQAPGALEWKPVLHPEDQGPTRQAWRKAVESGATYQIEHRVQMADGQYRWHLSRAYASRDSNGQLVKWFGTSTDIDDQRRAQEILEQKVQERTAELRNALADLESYSYSIAHDMRAPLRGMQGFSKILLEEHSRELGADAQQYLNRIAKSAERMDRLIQDVLNYSKIVSGEMNLERLEPRPLLEEIIESYPQLQKMQGHIRLEGEMPAVWGNRAALTQVFSNLLGNAVKFVAPGATPQVVVRAEPGGSTVRIWIQDNGIGIDPEAHGRIFQLFQRLNRPGLYEGTGLGLAIVRKSVQRMGGSVGVESQPGQGSRFWLQLRKAETVAPQQS